MGRWRQNQNRPVCPEEEGGVEIQPEPPARPAPPRNPRGQGEGEQGGAAFCSILQVSRYPLQFQYIPEKIPSTQPRPGIPSCRAPGAPAQGKPAGEVRARAVSVELRGQPCLGQPAGGHRFRRRSSLARPGARSPPGPARRTHSRAQSWRPAPGGSPRRGRGPGDGDQGRGPRGADAAGLSAGEGRRGGWRGWRSTAAGNCVPGLVRARAPTRRTPGVLPAGQGRGG